ncbi:MAG: VOC family protein [Gammaproteobacteria bacterium]|nr:VOC family protein [Gammaproteobacteria bacterium]MDH5344609.1 VOC family protein [Gammaproteobacteria bacterium]
MIKQKIVATLVAALVVASCATGVRPDLSGMSFSSKPLAGKIIWHDLISEDMDSAKRFYSGLFDWTFTDSQTPDGRTYAVARSGDVYVAGIVAIAAPDDGAKYSRWLPYMSVEDVDETVETGLAAGATVAVSARNVSLGRVAAIIDPEGAVIGLADSAFGDPDDATTAPAPGRAVWAELLSNDTAAATKFYAALGGYDVSTIDRRGGEYTLLSGAGANRAGILRNPAENYDPVWLTYFGVSDPAAAAARAEALGGRIILAASPELRDGSMAVVTDPAGAILVLQDWTRMGSVK